MDVDGEICIRRNFGSASVAKEYVQAQSRFFAVTERAPQRLILAFNVSFKKRFRMPPHLNPRNRGEAAR